MSEKWIIQYQMSDVLLYLSQNIFQKHNSSQIM